MPDRPAGAGLLEDLRDRQDDILRFVTDLRIPPTSNQAERDLCPPRPSRRSPDGSPAKTSPPTGTPPPATSPPPRSTTLMS
ncbi:transposase [Micromonospora sp. U56]|nr:transposase [Micromonospora sp. U56]